MKARVLSKSPPNAVGAVWWHLQAVDGTFPSYEEGVSHEFIVASAVVIEGYGPEVYLFPANAAGRVKNWGKLPGSSQGTLDHAEVLSAAGIEIVD